ncbi:hypothetical protein BGW80DRAFT_1287568 [Lactifluus volemus]|nr:hypothetical protein BGW80DRAFT_1287568 [Lactifluus volemus]
MQRQLGRDTILIVDALNYMKGFQFKLRVCTYVYVVATAELCRRWNSKRPGGRGYSAET